MPLAEIRDGVVIGMLVGRQEAKGHIFMGSGFDLARAIDPHAGAVKQEPQHHLWRIGRLAAAILGIVRGIDRTKVQRLHHIHQKARKMLLWKPIVQRRRQQQSLIQIVGAKTLSHEQHLKTDAHSSKRFCRTRKSIPDTLLDIEMPRMDGLTFLQKIMSQHPIPVIICSSLAEEGAQNTFKALEYGAVDIIAKPRLGTKRFLEESRVILCQAVKGAAAARLQVARPSRVVEPKLTADAILSLAKGTVLETTAKVIVIGASTGGTEALR